ncbi:hypothetical protein LOZ53_004368 [Ophidiomyces ophidiicola]|uniref:Uncharacterized protein n=1 Tax=Ophidiomyces ophidiicola TaxID=1387563 RepID=A0ACB8UZ45_9EURO|nr:uncharacterized protein LOZ57_000159 [Ophidiomyces ophidiicola]KAI1910548.1 hypothetical protein LOZ64_004928 [Ophidiomyces ophidiicola]KAI1953818.1 hypothetical protein LOZ57_000159 [Ophidiomyces ophidiicola]KAI1954772.1 hypothetical protein LOZ62_000549 [Ophidiomyces ophidiicola]KAI1970044.1 hypothetical protein LOZ56_003965 [Ophidiomyces ophidiicola]KAI1972576.1 hypothetical protein LOZ55_005746 [Ophidiomyces ophidiicola]
MARSLATGPADGAPLRYIPLSYNHTDSQASALRLVLALNPAWERAAGKIEFVRFTDGITNTLLKIIRRAPGLTDEEIDNEAVLMRAYGNHTEVIIDREKEVRSHALLAARGLAPPLLARFRNGLLYRFIRGQVASPHDLTQPAIWRGVARRLAQWHAVLPINETAAHMKPHHEADTPATPLDLADAHLLDGAGVPAKDDDIVPVATAEQSGGATLWTVLQKWIVALPATTERERERRRLLQREFERTVAELDDKSGLGENGLIFAHCDLLCANVIVQPKPPSSTSTANSAVETVSFIDYEYATPSPAAFDIANHFAEWGGYDCDYNMLPTRAVRRGFLAEYVQSYRQHTPPPPPASQTCDASSADDSDSDHDDDAALVDRLFRDVDRFRGIPGFYWGVWALIQATISRIDFDYASYAEERLGEYWAWRRELDGSRAAAGEEMPLRERRWAQEA